jgi:hypothetical protein
MFMFGRAGRLITEIVLPPPHWAIPRGPTTRPLPGGTPPPAPTNRASSTLQPSSVCQSVHVVARQGRLPRDRRHASDPARLDRHHRSDAAIDGGPDHQLLAASRRAADQRQHGPNGLALDGLHRGNDPDLLVVRRDQHVDSLTSDAALLGAVGHGSGAAGRPDVRRSRTADAFTALPL